MSTKPSLAVLSDTLRRDLSRAKSGETASIRAAFSVIRGYERLAGEVYAVRRAPGSSPEARSIAEDLLTSATHELIFSGKARNTHQASWLEQYRGVWKRNISLFWYALMLFLTSGIVGWGVISQHPEYTLVLIPQGMAERVLDHNQWFAEIQDAPLLEGFKIAINNITVCIKCFCAGLLFGLGGLAILCYNGLILGALFGYCHAHGMYEPLQIFALSHGPLELTIIIASAFTSLLYGRAFFMRPYRRFFAHLADGAKEALVLLIGITPWLVLAATLEAFVSPFPEIPVAVKVGVGVVAALVFWVWSFWGKSGDSAGSKAGAAKKAGGVSPEIR